MVSQYELRPSLLRCNRKDEIDIALEKGWVLYCQLSRLLYHTSFCAISIFTIHTSKPWYVSTHITYYAYRSTQDEKFLKENCYFIRTTDPTYWEDKETNSCPAVSLENGWVGCLYCISQSIMSVYINSYTKNALILSSTHIICMQVGCTRGAATKGQQ